MSPSGYDLADALMDAAELCIAPIWINQSLTARPDTVDNNGTCGLVDTGQRKVLLTAQHVLKQFRAMKRDHPEAVLAVNLGPGMTVAIGAPEVLAEDDALDLAVLASPSGAPQGPGKRYFPIKSWPIPSARRGEAVTIVGFPGRRRRTTESFGVFEPFGVGMTVSAVHDRSIILADETGTIRTQILGQPVDENIALGGFSGSPAFVLRGDGLHLIGILRAGSEEIGPGAAGGMVFLAPTTYLLPDGSLDRSRMPW
jgi:hypothetical protein